MNVPSSISYDDYHHLFSMNKEMHIENQLKLVKDFLSFYRLQPMFNVFEELSGFFNLNTPIANNSILRDHQFILLLLSDICKNTLPKVHQITLESLLEIYLHEEVQQIDREEEEQKKKGLGITAIISYANEEPISPVLIQLCEAWLQENEGLCEHENRWLDIEQVQSKRKRTRKIKELKDMLTHLHHYPEHIAYDVIEQAYKKKGGELFHKTKVGLMPLYVAAFEKRMNKECLDLMGMFTYLKTVSTDTELCFYPLSCESISDFFSYFKEVLYQLKAEGAMLPDEERYLTYLFLENSKHLNHTMMTLYLYEVETILRQYSHALTTWGNTKQVSDFYAHSYQYRLYDELMLANNDQCRTIHWWYEQGNIRKKWSRKEHVKTTSKSKQATIVVESEYIVFQSIYNKFILPIKRLRDDKIIIPSILKAYTENAINQLINTRIDLLIFESENNREYKSQLFSHIFLLRMERMKTTYEEHTLLLIHISQWRNLPFSDVSEDAIKVFLQDVMDEGRIDIFHETTLYYLLESKLNQSVLYEILLNYDENTTSYVVGLVSGEDKEWEVYKDKRNKFVCEFYRQKIRQLLKKTKTL